MEKKTRILGSKLVREIRREEMKHVSGGGFVPQASCGGGDTNVNQDYQQN